MTWLRLQHVRADGEIDIYHLKPGRTYGVGRGSNCEIRILDMKLSRRHCAISYANQTWQVADAGSTNGILVDGVKAAQPKALQQGTIIKAGSTTLVVAGFETTLPDLPPGPAASKPAAGERTAPAAPDTPAAPDPAPDRSDAPTVLAGHSGSGPAAVPPAPAEDPLATAPAAAGSAKIPSSQLFLNLLGRRVGPLTREQARLLKSKELKGTLSEQDLDAFGRS